MFKSHPTAGEDSEGGTAAEGAREPRVRAVTNFPDHSQRYCSIA